MAPSPNVTKGPGGKPAVTIYHNPRCNTSRTVLAAIRAGGCAAPL